MVPWSEQTVLSLVVGQAPLGRKHIFQNLSTLLPVAVYSFAGLYSWVCAVRAGSEREAEQREKLEVQNRLLQLEQKALQLQMNPHFIFNP